MEFTNSRKGGLSYYELLNQTEEGKRKKWEKRRKKGDKPPTSPVEATGGRKEAKNKTLPRKLIQTARKK